MLRRKMVNDVGIIMAMSISSISDAYALIASNDVFDIKKSCDVYTPISSVKTTVRLAIA